MITLELTHVSKLMSSSLISPPTRLLKQCGSKKARNLTQDLDEVVRVLLEALRLAQEWTFAILRCTLQLHRPMGFAADQAQPFASDVAVVK